MSSSLSCFFFSRARVVHPEASPFLANEFIFVKNTHKQIQSKMENSGYCLKISLGVKEELLRVFKVDGPKDK